MKLGRYEVVRELGKGAMGIVYLAKDPLIGRLVALKTIRPAAHSDDDETKEFQQRFMREAQAAGILNHPTIVTVHDVGQDPETGMSFIAMEYVEGQNLKEAIAQGRALTFEDIAEIVAQVADALDFAHSKGIVHRDVKPANIILVEGNRAKITDFGIAKIASAVANLTTTGQFLGTPNYMAPEQIKGAPVDGRSDLFSLGIVLYEALTKRKPFGGDSLTTISYRIVHESFPTLYEINPRIPEGFEEAVAKCLAKEPANRYQRGKDLAKDLRSVVIRGLGPVRPYEPALVDETVVTADKIPTLAIPFPDAEVASTPDTPSAMPAPAPAAGKRAETPRRAAAAASARRVGDQLRKTWSDVRASSIWTRPLSPPLFFGVIVAALALLGAAVLSIRSQQVPTGSVDLHAEHLRARERQLRMEGNQMVRAGNVDGAYERFQELSRIAPGSPVVTELLQKLASIKVLKMSEKQRLVDARTKFDEGLALFNSKHYADAVVLFDAAFHLDPNSEDAARFLKLAQQEQNKGEAATRSASRGSDTRVPAATSGRPAGTSGSPSNAHASDLARNAGTASLTVYFESPVNDGYIQVKSGGQVLLHENLFEEKGRAIFRRKVARTINDTKDVRAQGEVEIWVVIPSMNITEHQTMKLNVQPGSAHRLTVTFDKDSRKFAYQLS